MVCEPLLALLNLLFAEGQDDAAVILPTTIVELDPGMNGKDKLFFENYYSLQEVIFYVEFINPNVSLIPLFLNTVSNKVFLRF